MTCLHTPKTRLAGPATWAAVALTLTVGCGQKNDQKKNDKKTTDKPVAQGDKATDGLTMLEVGADAPDFTAEAHDGTTIAMKDLSGSLAVVYFYPKDATPG